jgi:hypothetical protein
MKSRSIDLKNCYDRLTGEEVDVLLKSLKGVLSCHVVCQGLLLLPAGQLFSDEQLVNVNRVITDMFGDLGKCSFITDKDGLIIRVFKTTTLCKICKLSMYELGDKLSNCKMQDDNIKECKEFQKCL